MDRTFIFIFPFILYQQIGWHLFCSRGEAMLKFIFYLHGYPVDPILSTEKKPAFYLPSAPPLNSIKCSYMLNSAPRLDAIPVVPLILLLIAKLFSFIF